MENATPPAPAAASLRYGLAAPPQFRRLNRFVLAAGAAVVGLFVVGIAGSAAGFDYTQDVAPHQALTVVFQVTPRDVWTDHVARELLPFIPIAAVTVSAFVLLRSVAAKSAVALLCFVLPPLLTDSRILLAPVLAWLPFAAFLGMVDGETWSEGFVAWGAVGLWYTLWLLVCVVLSVSWLRRFSEYFTARERTG